MSLQDYGSRLYVKVLGRDVELRSPPQPNRLLKSPHVIVLPTACWHGREPFFMELLRAARF